MSRIAVIVMVKFFVCLSENQRMRYLKPYVKVVISGKVCAPIFVTNYN